MLCPSRNPRKARPDILFMDSLEYNRAPDQKIGHDVEPKFGKKRKEQKHDYPQAQTTRDCLQLRIMGLPFHSSKVVKAITKDHQVEE
jgi:hypothetical protein